MKRLKVTLSIGVLVATMAVIGVSSSQVAFAEEGVVCNCMFVNGEHGTIRHSPEGDWCEINNCWVEID